MDARQQRNTPTRPPPPPGATWRRSSTSSSLPPDPAVGVTTGDPSRSPAQLYSGIAAAPRGSRSGSVPGATARDRWKCSLTSSLPSQGASTCSSCAARTSTPASAQRAPKSPDRSPTATSSGASERRRTTAESPTRRNDPGGRSMSGAHAARALHRVGAAQPGDVEGARPDPRGAWSRRARHARRRGRRDDLHAGGLAARAAAADRPPRAASAPAKLAAQPDARRLKTIHPDQLQLALDGQIASVSATASSSPTSPTSRAVWVEHFHRHRAQIEERLKDSQARPGAAAPALRRHQRQPRLAHGRAAGRSTSPRSAATSAPPPAPPARRPTTRRCGAPPRRCAGSSSTSPPASSAPPGARSSGCPKASATPTSSRPPWTPSTRCRPEIAANFPPPQPTTATQPAWATPKNHPRSPHGQPIGSPSRHSRRHDANHRPQHPIRRANAPSRRYSLI